MGQRYDIIVEAQPTAATSDENYWLRAGFIRSCARNNNPLNITGIVRYNTNSTADPTSTSDNVLSTSCRGEPLASLEPHMALDVENIFNATFEHMATDARSGEWFQWTLNRSSLHLNWSEPTLEPVFRNKSLFPTPYNVVGVQPSNSGERKWQVLVIQDGSGFGIGHPIHLHGYDFWILAAELQTTFTGDTSKFNTKNLSRRDVGVLPGNGYLAIAFELDNLGAWLVHCHIAWYDSQGLSLEFVESQSRIEHGLAQQDKDEFERACKSWKEWKQVWPQEDSGI